MNSANNRKCWNILNWNIRGINSDDKCNAIRQKLEENNCAVYCIQETKREHFDHSFIKKFAPKRYDQFAHSPSHGLSGGIILGWNSSVFSGQVIHNLNYAVTVKFTSRHNNETWQLTTVYGPCQAPEREEFINWLNDLEIQDNDNWMILGDFNFYRSLNDRNRSGGNINDIFIFNEVISNVGLQEIPLKGRKYTWSNMQDEPLLEQIDWCFTSTNWISHYPNTLLLPLSKPTSDHIPCMVQIDTTIPKADVFRFENFWVQQPDFFDLVQSSWSTEVRASNSVTKIQPNSSYSEEH
jgi:exonuclease III